MREITVKIVGHARSLFDSPSYAFTLRPGMTVKDLFNELAGHAGPDFSKAVFDVKTGRMNEHIAVFVNSREVRSLGGLDTRLKDGDEVTILPPMAGG